MLSTESNKVLRLPDLEMTTTKTLSLALRRAAGDAKVLGYKIELVACAGTHKVMRVSRTPPCPSVDFRIKCPLFSSVKNKAIVSVTGSQIDILVAVSEV